MPHLVRAMPGDPGRCAAAATRSFTASSRIGAPSGARNRFTNTKSLDAAAGTISRSNSYASNACTVRKSSGTARCRRDLANAPFGLSSRRTTCRCARTTSQPSSRESASRCTSLRRSPSTSPRRSPARAISSTISRSRADPHAPSTATTSPSDTRPTGRSGSCSRCRGRIRQPVPPSSARNAAGRSRSSATSYSTCTRCPGAVPSVTACTVMPRTAARTALIRRSDRTRVLPGPASTTAPGSASKPDTDGPACASHVMNSPSCPIPACQSRPDRAHHRKNSAMPPAYDFVVDSAPSRPNRS
jgi:hypothetical protein